MKHINAGRRYFATPQLRQIIQEQGRSFRWVANQVDLSDSHFNRVLSGERWVSEEHAQEIATKLMADFFSLWKVADATDSVEAA